MLLAAALALAGCGGGAKPLAMQLVRGPGYRFTAPQGWKVTREPHVIRLGPPGEDFDFLSVSTYHLPRVPAVAGIDAAAKALASRLHGRVVSSKTVRVAGRAARRYELEYSDPGYEAGLRLVFVLRGRREFQLLCRWQKPPAKELTAACDELSASFRPT